MAPFSVCSVYEGCRLEFLFYLFICSLRGIACSVYGASGGTLVAFTVLVGVYWALGLDVCGAF